MAGSPMEIQSKICILLATADEPMPIVRISERLGISKQLTFHHLSAMWKAGVVLKFREEGQNTLYSVQPVLFNEREFTELIALIRFLKRYIMRRCEFVAASDPESAVDTILNMLVEADKRVK